jgi:hypothetical protein
MTLLGWIVSAIAFAMGITLAIVSYRTSMSIISGNKQGLGNAIRNSVLSGVSVSLIFVGVASIISIRDPGYAWQASGIAAIILLALVAGIIATIGSLWQFYLAGKLRGHLSKRKGRDSKG